MSRRYSISLVQRASRHSLMNVIYHGNLCANPCTVVTRNTEHNLLNVSGLLLLTCMLAPYQAVEMIRLFPTPALALP